LGQGDIKKQVSFITGDIKEPYSSFIKEKGPEEEVKLNVSTKNNDLDLIGALKINTPTLGH
jgi:hypothetical protein